MDKDTKHYGHYFTFPLKFLWIDSDSKSTTLNSVISWSIVTFMRSGKCGNGNDNAKYKNAQGLLSFKGGSLPLTLEQYYKLNRQVSPNDIYTSVKTAYLFDARDGKFNFELLLLLAAVKSIIGHKRNFTLTYKDVVVKRMFGTEGKVTRYHFDKLVADAMARGLLNVIPAGRGIYVTIKYRNVDEFQSQIKKRIDKYESKKSKAVTAGKDLRHYRKAVRNQHKNTTAPEGDFITEKRAVV